MNTKQSAALEKYKSACAHNVQIRAAKDATLEQFAVAETECREAYAGLIDSVELDYARNETVAAAMRRTFPEV